MKIRTGFVVGLICGLVGSMAHAGEPGQRTLSFEERVKAQRAIERVYYAHQLGATKPFDDAVKNAVLEAKVHKYLDQTAALSSFWKTAVTDHTLQRELERMAEGTKMPERLLELYAALGNDPFLIKECLARPALVDRLTHNFYAFDGTLHAKEKAHADSIHSELVSGALNPSADHPNRSVGELVVSETEASLVPTEPSSQRRLTADEFKIQRAALPARPGEVSEIQETHDAFVFTVVLSETKKSVRIASYVVAKSAWDAWWETARRTVRGDAVTAVASGRIDLPAPRRSASTKPSTTCADDGWDNGSLDDLPEARVSHTALWTGNLMLVWGGDRGLGSYINSGGRYDPATDSWTKMSTIGAPVARPDATAVWTGSVMVIWGGGNSQTGAFNTGGRYDPNSDSWMPTSTAGAPDARFGHVAVWTGSVMVVWGGYGAYGSSPNLRYTGGRYDPATNTWTPTSTVGTPPAGYDLTAVWTGELMLVWGGYNGGRYDPLLDQWTPIRRDDAPPARRGYSAVWTGSAMVVWGGEELVWHDGDPGGGGYEWVLVNTGGRYDPLTDTWTPTSLAGAPAARSDHLAVWTGSSMVIWSDTRSPSDVAGARYDPATDSWTSMSSTGAPASAGGRTAVWAGNLMVVWGGRRGTSYTSPLLNTGGRYDPVTDSWTPTSVTNAPSTRYLHSAVWTGNAMVIWGGYYREFHVNYFLDSGGKYDPVIDDWTPTSTIGAPAARSRHAAVWAGDQMVVWGGLSDVRLDTGGRYDPVADVWTPTSTTGAPSPRNGQTAVWTGTQMAVWGGETNEAFVNTGGLYDPSTDGWTPISTTGAPSARYAHTALWTGNLMVVWGGYFQPASGSPNYLNTGGRYDPATDSWTPTSLTGSPSARADHSAVLAANQMVVWAGQGGSSGSTSTNTGGRYDVGTDTWTPTSTAGAPLQRFGHAAVSTGNLMMVWGGNASYQNWGVADPAGGWYDPAMDRWTKMSTAGQPRVVSSPAVWTGSAMIVWSSAGGGRYSLGSSLDTDCDGDGVSASAGDCDDHNASVYPGAPQLCDGIANDCLAPTWPDAATEDDFDQDGFRICQGDCSDRNASVYPGAPQLCDGINNDCNDPAPPNEPDNDNDGFRTCQGDCDDTRRWIYPGAPEYCDGRDNNCDGVTDEGGDALCTNSDVCWTATCDGLEGCNATPNAAPCDDANACTSDDVCANGYCQGTPLEGTPCDDYNVCTTNDVCGNYSCHGSPTMGNACDDYNICTIDDACANGTCHGGALLNCDDGDPCNGVEYCYWWDGCVAGTPMDCNDFNLCTDDSCDAAAGCFFTANTAACDDYNNCTSEDVCGGGQCQGTPRTGVACTDNSACTTNDTCNADGGCVGTPVNCNDGDACNGTEVCYPSYGCYPGSPIYCTDWNVCTSDSCNPATGCVFTNSTAACDDGNSCTSGDTCAGGACYGTPVVCNDNNACTVDTCHSYYGCVFDSGTSTCNDDNPCTSDACDPATGLCGYTNNDANPCSDGDACTQTDACRGGMCTGSNPVECGGACPPGFTAVDGQCQKTYEIHAGLLDNQDTHCDGTGVNRYNDCNALNYGFHWTDLGGSLAEVTRVDVQFESGLTCGGASSSVTLNSYPVGSFVPMGTCYCAPAHETVSFPGVDVGSYVKAGLNSISIDPSGECDGLSQSPDLGNNFARVTVTYRPYTDDCVIGVCDPGTGECTVGTSPDGTECDDHDPCTSGDSCDAGACYGTSLDCDDNNPCTDDSCDPSTGCAHVDNVATCDDGNACTTGDICGDGTCHGDGVALCDDGSACNGSESCDPGSGCVAGAPLVCNDDNPCTTDTCNPATGCVFTNNANACNDGNACTTADTCGGGACVGGTPLVCSDGNSCTTDTCNPAIGCLFTNNTNACDDGNACTTDDTCGGGSCIGGAPLACNDNNPCTTDACNPATGCVFNNNTNACNDGNACTRTDVCSGGACVGGNAVVCGALDQCHDAGTCNPGTGACSNPAKPNGTVCDDASLCTTGETCQSGTCTPAYSGLNHPAPKSAGYYKKLCQQRDRTESHYQGDELTEGDAMCVGQLTSTFAGMATIDNLCEVINSDHRPPHGGRHHGGPGDGTDGKDCDRGEDELIATALNICRARVCEEQNLDSRCHGNTLTTVSQSFADADAILDDAARNKDTCKSARCELREINNGHALEMNSLTLARENRKVRLTWSSPVLDDGSGAPSSYELWRRPMGSNDAFVKLGTTSGLTFLDATAGTAAWEYDITAVIPGN